MYVALTLVAVECLFSFCIVIITTKIDDLIYIMYGLILNYIKKKNKYKTWSVYYTFYM